MSMSLCTSWRRLRSEFAPAKFLDNINVRDASERTFVEAPDVAEDVRKRLSRYRLLFYLDVGLDPQLEPLL
jgi:hypothetical protein